MKTDAECANNQNGSKLGFPFSLSALYSFFG